ncbi:MAG: sulfotransferase family protein [Phycisphaerales bacterium JB039]
MTAISTDRAGDGASPAAAPPGLVFLTGCGRSGTTILGTILSQRPDVSYLNDRFRLWTDVFLAGDIWGMNPESRQARVALGASDVTDSGRAAVFARLEKARAGKAIVLEKLAINNFRLPFLRALAPSARFINIIRHGVEVARSIARKVEAGEWYGVDDRKWPLLCEHAEARGLGDLAASCRTPYERGLLEWRMSVEAAAPVVEELGGRQLIQVTYAELIDFPDQVIARIERFLRLPHDETAAAWAATNVRRLNPAADEAPAPESTDRIAGATLRRFGYTW